MRFFYLVPGPWDKEAIDQLRVTPLVRQDEPGEWTGKVVEKPWGQEREVVRAGPVSIWELDIMPGAETSMHCHPNKATLLTVAAGSVTIETLKVAHELVAGDVAFVPAGVFHRTKTKTGAKVLEQETPPAKADLVRLMDAYGRVGKGYEVAAG